MLPIEPYEIVSEMNKMKMKTGKECHKVTRNKVLSEKANEL